METDRRGGQTVECSCCGVKRDTVALASRDDVRLCRDCVDWLSGKLGIVSTPTLPVRDLNEAIDFYERAGFRGARLQGGRGRSRRRIRVR